MFLHSTLFKFRFCENLSSEFKYVLYSIYVEVVEIMFVDLNLICPILSIKNLADILF